MVCGRRWRWAPWQGSGRQQRWPRPSGRWSPVFALENKGTRFKQEELDRLLDYVGASLTSSGRYTVVPQDELKRALQTQKAASYKACYAESCQIEIGKELAATKTLAGTVSRFGRTCLVTLKLFDLAQAVQDAAGTGKGGCSEEAVMASLDAALAQVSGVSDAPKAQVGLQTAVPAPAAQEPPKAPPSAPPVEMVPSSCAYAVLDDGGNACGRGDTTWPVGSKPAGASPYGALDMAGNVWEWTSDWYEAEKTRVVRGGCYGSGLTGVRASARSLFSPRDRLPHVGFRCAGS